MNELNVLVVQEPGIINFNYNEIKAALVEKMELYKDAQFTEDSKNIAKKEIAALRNIKSAIDEKRKTVKNECLKPYADFEEKAKELMRIIDEPINLIDSQVKAFDEKRKQEKMKKIQEIYIEVIGDMGEYLPLDTVFNTKWLNVATSVKSITDEITNAISSAREAVNTLSTMQSESVSEALKIYKKTLSLADALTYINKYEQQKAEILKKELERQRLEEERKIREREQRIREEERQRIANEERIRREEREKVEMEKESESIKVVPAIEEPFAQDSQEVEVDIPFIQPDTITAIYKVIATPDELGEVEMAFNSIGIYFVKHIKED